MFTRSLILKTSSLGFVQSTVRQSKLFRPLVRRFIAGDSLEQSLPATEALLKKGLLVTLDYLGENTANESEALQAKQTYKSMLTRLSTVPPMPEYIRWTESDTAVGQVKPPPVPDPINISIKLTQCGLDQGEAFAENNFREVLATASGLGSFVRVDMEGSEYTERTMAMMERVLPDFPNTGTVLQSYLFRTDEDVEKVIEWQARVRLVKGAYLEPSSVAFPEKDKVDEAYVRQAKRLLDAAFYPALATHDEGIINELKEYANSKEIEKSRFEFQMLYGIRRDLQESLVSEGYNVRIYVPFGDSWYPYFTRRLAERPANAFFILKSFIKG
jgi:proline dehydrogenase